MKIFKKLFMTTILAASLGLSGCAAIQEATCNHDAAYSQGINDAKDGKDMDSNYAMICPAGSNKAALNHAYTKGFRFALKNSPTVININNGRRHHRRHRRHMRKAD